MDKLKKDLEGKKILILGFGKEGRATLKKLRQWFPEMIIGVADKNTELISVLHEKHLVLHLGEDYLKSIYDYDVVIKSPGISLENVQTEKIHITSQTDIFLTTFRNRIIGVTGTKGKSTTASLIYHFLKSAQKKSVLLGNIGVPAFEKLDVIDDDTIIVYELSAHQLQNVHNSPHIAVLLNIFPEHLDFFKSFEDYRAAKFNINRFQQKGDLLVVEKTLKNQIINSIPQVEFIENEFYHENIPLKGSHNLKNIEAAVKAVQKLGISAVKALKSLSSFKPLPHRLEYVGNYGRIDFYNDSIATVPEAVIEAVKTLENVDTIILGGYDRGLDYAELLCFLRDNKNVRNLIFTGKAGEIMYQMIMTQPKNGKKYFFVDNMGQAFDIIKKYTPENGTCLLSPAAASYDMYHNFEHRGDIFKTFAKNFNR